MDPSSRPGASEPLAPTPPRGVAASVAEPPIPRARHLSAGGWIAAAVGLILCVGAGDYLTGSEVSLILFYLAPIGFGTWFASLRGGVALAFVGAIVSVAANALHLLDGVRDDDLTVTVIGWNGLMNLGTSIAVVLVLGALKSRLEGEELLARTDALTQISNRRAFIEAATLELERARRHGRPLTVAYVDCDDFKLVNDRSGHAQGDALLVTIAQTLRGGTRAVDAVARLGGDEFGLLLPETDASMAETLLARLRAMLVAGAHGHGWKVGFSIGAATFLAPPDTVDDLMARADELMYDAKRTAKGSVRTGVFGTAPLPTPGAGAAEGSP